MKERLQKILARAGFGSRRACEELIRQKRVVVNGKVVGLGDQANSQSDKITVDGRPLPIAETFKYIALHKPRKVLSDNDPEDDRQTVFDLVPVEGHLFSVGRLDYNSEGLILLTNDGELANKLTHPRYGHEKEYRVLVASHPDEKQIGAWRRGVVMEDGTRTLPAHVSIERAQGKGIWLKVILREGRKRQIREVCTRIGLSVVTILRVRINTLELGNLKPRQWRHLSESEVEMLRQAPSSNPTSGPTRRPTGNPTSGPTRRPTGRPTSRPTNRPTGRPSSGSTNRPTGRPSSGSTSRPSRPTSGSTSGSSGPSSRPTSKPGGKPAGKPGGKPAGASKPYQRSPLPTAGRKPTARRKKD